MHYGFSSIQELIFNFISIFEGNSKGIGEALFKIDSISEVTLLRKRLNLIIFYLALKERVGSYWGYKRDVSKGGIEEHFEPVEKRVDWNKYDRREYDISEIMELK